MKLKCPQLTANVILKVFPLFGCLAIIIFRLPWTWTYNKLVMKWIHAGLHFLAFTLAVISTVAVFDFHNSAKIPNMYSLHSWLGITAVILYSLQVAYITLTFNFLVCNVISGAIICLCLFTDCCWSRLVPCPHHTHEVEGSIHALPCLLWYIAVCWDHCCGTHGHNRKAHFCLVS